MERRRAKHFCCGAGLKRVLVCPLEQVLMPYWTQLHKNRCVVTVNEALLPAWPHIWRRHIWTATGLACITPPQAWDEGTTAPHDPPADQQGVRGSAQPSRDHSFKASMNRNGLCREVGLIIIHFKSVKTFSQISPRRCWVKNPFVGSVPWQRASLPGDRGYDSRECACVSEGWSYNCVYVCMDQCMHVWGPF